MASVVAVILGVASILLVLVTVALHSIAQILGVTAVFVGVISTINARRQPRSAGWLGFVGAGLGAVTAVVVAVATIL
jgi:uncharacterized membrane protein HdeD (DUF308 family)